MLNHFVIYGIMVFSLVLSGIITLILLGIAENEVIDDLRIDVNVLSREELRALVLLINFTIITGVLEAILVGILGIILSLEAIPYIIVLLSGRLKYWR